MEKIKVQEIIIVEGRYDASALASLVDALIITTDGFSIFSNPEKKALIQKLGRRRGIVILTDSDAAGFKIRHYIEKIAAGCVIKNAYIPALPGKESRKSTPSKEGTLGVEGIPAELLRQALSQAQITTTTANAITPITYTDLYELGLSGGPQSAARRRALLVKLGLPPRLSKRALSQVLSSLYTKRELQAHLASLSQGASPPQQRPALFWDFHGTLTLPDVLWFEAAMEAAAQQVPQRPLKLETLERYFTGTCLPWFSVPSHDTRHLAAPGAWWAHCEREFVPMFQNCGFTRAEAEKIAPAIREKILQPHRYHLYPDAASTLQALQDRGYQNYVLSNNFPELAQVVARLGLAEYFCGVLVSAEVGYDKPHPGIFAAARGMVGEARACWIIGDNPVDDVEGGKAAGFTTVLVHGKHSPLANHNIGQLSEVLGLLP